MRRLPVVLCAGLLYTLGCSADERNRHGGSAGVSTSGTAGAAAANTSGAGGAVATGAAGNAGSARGGGLGGSAEGGLGAQGGAAGGSTGGAAGGSTGGAAGVLAGAGGAVNASAGEGGAAAGASGGPGAPIALDLPALAIHSDTTSVEFTPALLAAQIYSDWSTTGKAMVSTGGVGDLSATGNVDLATNSDTRFLTESASKPNLRVLCTVTETFYRILARRADVAVLADLAGKRVASLTTTSAHYYVHSLLDSAGITDDEVTFVSGSLANLPTMLDDGQVDAISIWEPAMQRAVNALGDGGIEFEFADKEAGYREMVNLYTTSERLDDMTKRRGIVEFTRALLAAADRFTNAPDEVRELVAGAMNVEPALVTQFWQHERFPGKLTEPLLELMAVEEVWLAQRQNRTARTQAELAGLIDPSVLAEAMTPR